MPCSLSLRRPDERVAQPIVFVSHFTVKPGKLDELRRLARDVAERIEADKPETALYLAYLDDKDMHITFVHLFADAEAMDRHFEGAEERSGVAAELMDPAGWEIYGMPSDAALGSVREAARSAGVNLRVQSEYLAGFTRVPSR